MKEQYFDSSVTDPMKALKRFETVAATNHHSIAQHGHVTIVIEGISKALATILNDLTFYATSEKSGRYTVMMPETAIEKLLYEKWTDIFHDRIRSIYPDMDKLLVDRFAMDYARYFISPSSSTTTMSYTTAVSQWMYISDWAIKYSFKDVVNTWRALDANDNAKDIPAITKFFEKLHFELLEFGHKVKRILNDESLHDPKGRKIMTYSNINALPESPINVDAFRDQGLFCSYQKMSFVSFAQLQRHRTLHIASMIAPDNNDIMNIDNAEENFAFPPFLQLQNITSDATNKLRLEYTDDLIKLCQEGILPNAFKFHTKMSGSIDNFMLACTERLCGRAHYESQTIIKNIHDKYIKPVVDASGNVSHDITKCSLLGTCKEPCYFKTHGNKSIYARLV